MLSSVYVIIKKDDRIFVWRIYWLFAENLTTCITDSPEIRNPIRIHINNSNQIGRSENREFPIPASRDKF
jgi:hypothetical protein